MALLGTKGQWISCSAAAPESPCMTCAILWLLGEMTVGGATAAQGLWWFQPCLASAGAEITWGFPTEVESILGGSVAVTKVRELMCWLAQPFFLLTLLAGRDILPSPCVSPPGPEAHGKDLQESECH